MHVTRLPKPTPILRISSLTNNIVKENRDLCPETLEKCEKTDWMYNLQTRSSFSRMLLDVCFVTSKLGLLNVNDFSLMNLILLNENLKLLNI